MLHAPFAGAVCSSPAGEAGTLRYDGSEVMFCDGYAWSSAGGSTPATGTGCTPGKIEAVTSPTADLRFCNSGGAWKSMDGTVSGGACSPDGKFRYNQSANWYEWCKSGSWLSVSTPAVTYKQSASFRDSGGSDNAVSATFTPAVTNGSFILCASHVFDMIPVTGMTDNRGNTYVRAGTSVNLSGIGYGYRDFFYANNVVGGASLIVTATLQSSATGVKELSCQEYAGVVTSNPIDQFQAFTGTTSGGSSTVTTTSAKELLWLGTFTSNTNCTVMGGWFLRDTLAASNRFDTTVNTIGTKTVGANSCASQWSMVAITIRSK